MPLPQHDISLNKETIVHKKVVFHFSTCPRNATECSLLFRSFVRTQLTIINIYTYTYKCVCIAKFSSNVLFVCMSIETAVKFQSNSIQHLSNAYFNMNNNKCEQHQSNHISAYKNWCHFCGSDWISPVECVFTMESEMWILFIKWAVTTTAQWWWWRFIPSIRSHYTEYFIINWINLHADENISSTAGYKN